MKNRSITGISAIAIVVTYGDRWHLASKTIQSIAKETCFKHLVLVDNECPYDLGQKIIELKLKDGWVILHKELSNLGSAGGIKAGMERALALQGIDYIFIIDDDNIPVQGSIDYLISFHLNSLKGDKNTACLAYRPNHGPYMRKIAHGAPVEIYTPKRNSFAGFNIFNLYRNYRLRQKSKNAEDSPLLDTVQIFVAPWSGLLMPIELVKKAGYPDERYFVYVDDTAYTYQLTKHGGQIFMVTSSTLEDMELSWVFHKVNNEKVSRFPMIDFTGFRAYYRTRNLIYFSSNQLTDNHLIFWFNGIIFTLVLFFLAGVRWRWKAYYIYLLSVRDGITGRLGRNKKVENMF